MRVNDPFENALIQDCKVIFENRVNNFNVLINDSNIYTAKFKIIIISSNIENESECLEISVSDNQKMMLSFSSHNVYKKENNNNWELIDNSLNSRFKIKADHEYVIITGTLRLGLQPDEVHHNRDTELYFYSAIFKTNKSLINVLQKMFNQNIYFN